MLALSAAESQQVLGVVRRQLAEWLLDERILYVDLESALRLHEGVEQHVYYRCWERAGPDGRVAGYGIKQVMVGRAGDRPQNADYVLELADFDNSYEVVHEITRLLATIVLTDPTDSEVLQAYRADPTGFVSQLPENHYVLDKSTDPYVTRHGRDLRLYLRGYRTMEALLRDVRQDAAWAALHSIASLLLRLAGRARHQRLTACTAHSRCPRP